MESLEAIIVKINLLAISCGIAIATSACSGDPVARTPVVLIVIDTLRADHVGVFGSERATTPHIDALARDGVRFDRAYSQAPWTTPSIGSLLSSQYPSTLGIEHNRSRIPEAAEMLPEVLVRAGYATSGVVSHSFCNRRWGFAQGFDRFDESNVLGEDVVSADGVSDVALTELEGLGEQPFFLFLHFFDPHVLYLEHEGFPLEGRARGYDGPIQPGLKFRQIVALESSLSPADLTELTRIYDSEVALTDHHVGRVLERLRAQGLYDRSLIVLTADHGEEFLDHGRIGHAKTIYDELTRVPLIVKPPADFARSGLLREPGSVVSIPVGLVDVYPTILDITGVSATTMPVGLSLLDEARGPVFTETSRRARLRAIIDGRYKLIADLDGGTGELYDLETDPGETRDISALEPDIALRLGGKLDSWISTNVPGGSFAPSELLLEEAERARLRALGYAE